MPNKKQSKRRSVSKRRSQQKKRSQSRSKINGRDKFSRYLATKITYNIKEYRKGRWVSPQQAIAVSYSQARKKYPRSAGARRSLEYLERVRNSKK